MTDRPAHLLRRRTTDRVIGGVAGGLGDYFNVDPLLIRIGFVGLIIFGGAGLVLYLIAWLLMPPEGQEAGMLESFFRRFGLTPGRIGRIVLIVGFAALVLSIIGGADLSLPAWGERPVALWAALVIVLGVLLLRRHEDGQALAAGPRVLVAPRASAVPRPPSPLGWYVLAATLIAVGLLAIVSQAAKVEVTPGQFFGAALTVIGIGLVVGAWWGRARVLILLALFLLPMAVAASFVTAPLEGGIGDNRYAPANAAELRAEYRLMGGRVILDLTDLSIVSQPIHIAASVAVGQLRVILPPKASIEIHTRVGAGVLSVFDASEGGTSLDNVYVRRHQYGPNYILDLETGIGEVQVFTQPAGNN
ncbi:MAG: PspC domain-containing protein [Candidatus Limnocylindria bacterium]